MRSENNSIVFQKKKYEYQKIQRDNSNFESEIHKAESEEEIYLLVVWEDCVSKAYC